MCCHSEKSSPTKAEITNTFTQDTIAKFLQTNIFLLFLASFYVRGDFSTISFNGLYQQINFVNSFRKEAGYRKGTNALTGILTHKHI